MSQKGQGWWWILEPIMKTVKNPEKDKKCLFRL